MTLLITLFMLLTYFPEIKYFGRMYLDLGTRRGVALPEGLFPFAFEADPGKLPPIENAITYYVENGGFDRLYEAARQMDTEKVRALLREHNLQMVPEAEPVPV
jgi:hypothetical protein